MKSKKIPQFTSKKNQKKINNIIRRQISRSSTMKEKIKTTSKKNNRMITKINIVARNIGENIHIVESTKETTRLKDICQNL